MLQENVEFTFSKSYLKGLQAPMQFYILPNNSTKKKSNSKKSLLKPVFFPVSFTPKKKSLFLKTLVHSVSHCLTSLLTHLYFQTSCLHFFPLCLPSRHMPTPPPLSQGVCLCLVYSSSCGSFGNSSHSCDKQDFFYYTKLLFYHNVFRKSLI